MASLAIQNVTKHYGPVLAVANVSINVENGEFLVLVGPSGCGKSTLLRMVAGLESVGSGRILMDGRDMDGVDPKDRDIAMVFQNYALYPHMTVFENMAFGLQQRRVPKSRIREIVAGAARTLDLEELAGRKPSELSGGQRQRVAMGRAIVRNPAIYLLDEPLSNLDAKLRVHMRSELKLLRSRLGVTTIYVTHDQTEAMTLGDRVAVLKPVSDSGESNLQQIDTPQILYLRPKNLFVAGFIGSPAMNFLYADVGMSGGSATARIVGTAREIALPASKFADGSALANCASKRVVMGIRPEFFSIAQQDAGEQAIEAEILVTELVGPDAYLHFDLDTPEVELADVVSLKGERDTRRQASRFVARIESGAMPGETARMKFRLDAERLHFFDPATGAAIC